ncbi:uncharacterized protein LOC132725949 [Ruditapes philippinarum]|uniref:uncharacterized protein LOC132725949 n=1 Tax=Ruditapes philippinarum TaxID=129788 RepID=UPI00295B4CD3|nr:uncharacterized protein LOC132725949 [Ruditapes philippinarum]
MKAKLVVLCMSLFVGATYARLGKDALRKALNSDPFFSAPRNSPVPFMQNRNIRLPLSDVPIQATNDRPSNARLPTLEAKTRGNSGIPVKPETRIVPVPVGRPSRAQEVRLGQIKPANVVKRQEAVFASAPVQDTQPKVSALKNTVNDRLLNSMRPAATAASAAQQRADSKQECAFIVPDFFSPNQNVINSEQTCPAFLIPGPTLSPGLVTLLVQHFAKVENVSNSPLDAVRSKITQSDFELNCLYPALRAHVMGGTACRTRNLRIYLEWLLFLRKRLFNI